MVSAPGSREESQEVFYLDEWRLPGFLQQLHFGTSSPRRSAKSFKPTLLPACVWLCILLARAGILAADTGTEKEILLFLVS